MRERFNTALLRVVNAQSTLGVKLETVTKSFIVQVMHSIIQNR